MWSRFPRLFKPFCNVKVWFQNNPVFFTRQLNTQQVNEENPFMKKYADRIAAFQSSNPEEYHARLEKLKSSEKPKSNIFKEKKLSSMKQDMAKPPLPSAYSYEKKTLESIMKLDLLEDKSPSEIETIWKQYHKDKPGLYAILPREVHKGIIAKLTEYPTFLFPLPKAEGYEFVLCQFSGNSCHFTQLINYQAYKENAPVCLTITYYSELQENKGIVLMRGEFDENTMKPHEAQFLSNQLQLYYGGNDPKKDRLLWNFNRNPDNFRHMDLISELEFGVVK